MGTFNVDLSGVDLVAVVQSRGVQLRRIGRELHGPCPKCGGTDKRGSDRFRVTVDGDRQRFACRKCNPKGGDAIDFLRWLDGISFAEALHELDAPVDCDTVSLPSLAKPAGGDDIEMRSIEWINAFDEVTQIAHANLIGGRCDQALEYLARRGIMRSIIDFYRIGYNDTSRRVCNEWWIDRGITIPRKHTGLLYAVNVRRRADDLALDELHGRPSRKYRHAQGGTVRAPFNMTRLFLDQDGTELPVVFVTGGEFDAMLTTYHSPAGSLAITLGGETTRPAASVLELLKGRRVIVMTDNDATGEASARMWQSFCPSAERVRVPEGKDATEFYQLVGAYGFGDWLSSMMPGSEPAYVTMAKQDAGGTIQGVLDFGGEA